MADNSTKEALARAIKLAGNQTNLAAAMTEIRSADKRINQSHVWAWLNRGKVQAECVLDLCQAVEWQVRPHDIRPDLYPNSWDGLPAEQLAGSVAKMA